MTLNHISPKYLWLTGFLKDVNCKKKKKIDN